MILAVPFNTFMGTKKTNTKQVKSSPKTKTSSNANTFQKLSSGAKTRFQSHQVVYSVLTTLLVIAIVIVGVFVFRKDLFLAGKINGKLVTTPEFYSLLTQSNGEASFEALVRDTLILQEAAKKGITASQEEIDGKIAEIEERFGGKEGLDQVLSLNNVSETQFQDQLITQILVEKLFEEEVSVSDEEVNKYIKENKLETQGLSKDDVREQLKAQKLNEQFTKWFEEVKNNADIQKYF